MSSIIHNEPVVVREVVKTKEGEITVNLNISLSISLDQSGSIKIEAKTEKVEENLKIIPEFEPNDTLLNFGDNK